MEHNLILQGWLIKSPPENKSSGPFKLFKAKWRRRWFVLYEPLASESLPGTRAALDYYSNEKVHKKLGSIDLDHCEEVLFKLESPLYKHLFSLRTKHKGYDRIYYLGVSTEQDMMKWVDCLCLALGLKENEESSQVSSEGPPSHPQPVVPSQQRSSPASMRGLPPGYTDLHSETTALMAPLHPNGNHSSMMVSNNVGSYPNHTQRPMRPATDIPVANPKAEAYIPLVDCYTGQKHSDTLGDKDAEHRVSTDSIPPEPPPAPPQKMGRKLLEEVVTPGGDPSLYDSPTKSYVNIGVDDNENVYKIARSDTDALYKVPRGSVIDEEKEGIYKLPRSDHEEDQEGIYKMPRDSEDQEGIYKIPRNEGEEEGVYNIPRNVERIHSETSDDEGIYKIPRHEAVVEDEGIYKLPRPVDSHDVSVFSQVPVPSDSMTGSVMSTRHSPDGEASPLDDSDIPTIPPPPRPTRNSHSSNDSQGSEQSPNSGPADLYDTPRNMGLGHTMPRSTELYDAPKSCRKTVSENNLLESVVPAPSRSRPSLHSDVTPFVENRYQNLPPSLEDSTFPRSSRSGHVATPTRPGTLTSHYYNQNAQHPVFDDVYDIPPPQSQLNDTEKLVHSPPPPPKACASVLHSYVNVKDDSSVPVGSPSATSHESFYMPMALGQPEMLQKVQPNTPVLDSMTETYTDMASISQEIYSTPPSNRPVNPSVHDVVPPPSKTRAFLESQGVGDDTYVFHSHRTRSFKRPMPRNSNEVVLPTRRTTGLSDDISSSDDEESSSSGSHHDKSSDNISYRMNYQLHSNPSLAPKIGSLNCTPPAPKRQGEVQYLDLALEENSDPDKSPLSIRSPAPGNVSPTDYKEIDFVKTKALNDTQKAVESNRRKSSERSVDE